MLLTFQALGPPKLPALLMEATSIVLIILK